MALLRMRFSTNANYKGLIALIFRRYNLPTLLFNGLPPFFPASQQPAHLPSHGGRISSYSARSRLNRRGARRPAIAGGRQRWGEPSAP
ncbi:hypothetical protein KC19_1G100400 [Ceratodon purpureus]|uniref:Uncharacterized protein n=1 Tax=Ceratodon purpureus TaxID=3225 RepID=A0A8T0J6B1_CERPU|nr:hypothetical protein KC19_1G100400 [Ceratodon purpureus]